MGIIQNYLKATGRENSDDVIIIFIIILVNTILECIMLGYYLCPTDIISRRGSVEK